MASPSVALRELASILAELPGQNEPLTPAALAAAVEDAADSAAQLEYEEYMGEDL